MIPEKPIQTFSFIKDFMRKKHHFLLLSSLFIIVLFTFPAYSTPSLDDTLILEDFEDGILDSSIRFLSSLIPFAMFLVRFPWFIVPPCG